MSGAVARTSAAKSVPKTSQSYPDDTHHESKTKSRTWTAALASRQIELSAVPIALVLTLNLFYGPPTFSLKALHPLHLPSLDPTFHLENIPAKFLFLSYLDPRTGLCLKGGDDFYLVVFWVFVWTFCREASMRWFWAPIAKLQNIQSRSSIKRFAEQGWGLSYAIVSWTTGMYVLATSPYADKLLLWPTDELFIGYPHFSLPPMTKFYYLVQMAFWVHTLMALNIEKRRKDYMHMLLHHIVTIMLLVGSYATNFTRVGSLIMCQMDPVDILLPTAKMFKYLGYHQVSDLFFALFLVTWIITRHIFFTATIWKVVVDLPNHVPYVWDPPSGRFLNLLSHCCYVVLLVTLQCVLFLWLCMILLVVKKILMGSNAEDVRSDSEEDSDDDLELEEEEIDEAARKTLQLAQKVTDRRKTQ